MQYRDLGKTGIKISALGFGMMRLPLTVSGDTSKIDIKKSTEMVRFAIDNGVNYFDTAWGYHKQKSEPFLGKALKRGYRGKVHLATKLSPLHLIKKEKDIDKIFNEQLRRLKTDYVDFYLFHAMNRDRWKMILEMEALEWAEKQIKKGRIRYLGFSFHDILPVFKKIIRYYKWDVCQMQYNYIDINFQAGTEGLKYANKKGIPVIAMEPLKGGTLVNPPKKIKELINGFFIKRTPTEWCLHWVWNHPEISHLLSGMSALTHVKQNIRTASKSGQETMSLKEMNFINKLRKTWLEISPIICTRCEYCLPCPHGINIPFNFTLYNNAHLYFVAQPRNMYHNMMKKEERAVSCKECGECETKCPQNLSIIKLLKDVDKLLKRD